jgi:hypothetical protein
MERKEWVQAKAERQGRVARIGNAKGYAKRIAFQLIVQAGVIGVGIGSYFDQLEMRFIGIVPTQGPATLPSAPVDGIGVIVAIERQGHAPFPYKKAAVGNAIAPRQEGVTGKSIGFVLTGRSLQCPEAGPHERHLLVPTEPVEACDTTTYRWKQAHAQPVIA